MRRSIVVACLIALISPQVWALPSITLDSVWDLPLNPVAYDVIKSRQSGQIQLEEIYYQSRDYQGEPEKIFGYYAYPVGARNLPAILISHGGGGHAEQSTVISWAKRGYAVLAIDLPGKGFQRDESRSTGPDMDVPLLLATRPDPRDNYLVHAVAAIRNGITFLTQRSEVNPERIGMVGLSWGGVLTLLTNGQDDRLKTAVNVFGAGYISEGSTWQERFNIKTKEELAEWNSYIDPRNFLTTQHAPILFITGTNDHCYYLPTFQKSYAEVTVPKKMVLIPNLRHKFLPEMRQIVWNWLDNKLKDKGSFPAVTVRPIFKKRSQDKLIVPVEAAADTPVVSTALYYTKGGPSRWTKRRWQKIDGYYENGYWYFGLPMAWVEPDLMFYVSAKDQRGSVASSQIRSIFKVRLHSGEYTYAMSSPIQQINIHEPPLQVMGLNRAVEIIKIFFSKQNQTYHLWLRQNTSLYDQEG